MPHPPLAAGWIDRPHHLDSIGPLSLEGGGTIHDCRLSWVEHGERRGDNTVLALTAIGATHHRLDFLIGPGRALDPARFHVIVVDALGNGLSSSPSNSPTQAGADFPTITIRDMVESQRRLLDALGVTRLKAVVGASMGGMQALQWAASHPDRMERVVAMTAMGRTSLWSQLMNDLARRALFEDAEFRRPQDRAEAMRLWVPLTQFVMATTPESVERLAGQDVLLAELDTRARYFAEHGPDPFDWLCQSRAYDAHDVGPALSTIRARVLLATARLDLYNPAQCSVDLAGRIPNAELVVIPSHHGHRAAGDTDPMAAAFLNQEVGAFLGGR
jgi:homoserine O-acetyltransferase/O-succinyltransferase